LRFVHRETEGPREGGYGTQRIVGENRAVHLRYDVMVEGGGHVFEQRYTVDVQSRIVERPIGGPFFGIGLGRNDVDRLDWVVEIREVNFGVGGGHGLILGLCEENFVFVVDEEFTLIRVEVDVRTVHLDVTGGERTSAAPDSNLDIVILETDEGERLGPVITEKEWKDVVVGVRGGAEGILRNFIEGHGTRRFSLVILVQEIVDTLNV